MELDSRAAGLWWQYHWEELPTLYTTAPSHLHSTSALGLTGQPAGRAANPGLQSPCSKIFSLHAQNCCSICWCGCNGCRKLPLTHISHLIQNPVVSEFFSVVISIEVQKFNAAAIYIRKTIFQKTAIAPKANHTCRPSGLGNSFLYCHITSIPLYSTKQNKKHFQHMTRTQHYQRAQH